MKDIFDAEKRYKNTLLNTKIFLKEELKKPNGSSLIEERVDYLLSKNAECPVCGVKFEGVNHNTEHIVPLTIGGKNVLENKIQMCVICNHSRNQVMQALFPRGPLHFYYPEKWIEMKKFILWCELSIDDKELAAVLIPAVHAKFMEYRTGGAVFPVQAKKAFGRASTWKLGDEPNYQINNNTRTVANKKMNIKKQNRGIILRFFDKIFDFEPKKNVEVVSTVEIINSINKIKQSPPKKAVSREQKYPLITNLNSSKTGLRLPNGPHDFAKVMIWYVNNCNNYPNWKQRKAAIKELNIVAARRAFPSLVAMNSVLCENGEYDVEKIESSLLSDLTSLINAMKEKFSQYDLVFGSDETESNANLENYFEAVKDYVLTLDDSMNIEEE